jgi:selenocysteine lyase/cysteine desulfurase
VPYKVRAATNEGPGRWETGTKNHAALAGTIAAVEYLAELGRAVVPTISATDRRAVLLAAMAATRTYELQLLAPLLEEMQRIPGLHIGLAQARPATTATRLLRERSNTFARKITTF